VLVDLAGSATIVSAAVGPGAERTEKELIDKISETIAAGLGRGSRARQPA
jgi:hypothetical protein